MDLVKGFMILLVIVIGFFGMCGVSCDSATVETLNKAGFTNAETTGWAPMSCGQDLLRTGFEATNAKGNRITGAVCCGVFKNCTIRF